VRGGVWLGVRGGGDTSLGGESAAAQQAEGGTHQAGDSLATRRPSFALTKATSFALTKATSCFGSTNCREHSVRQWCRHTLTPRDPAAGWLGDCFGGALFAPMLACAHITSATASAASSTGEPAAGSRLVAAGSRVRAGGSRVRAGGSRVRAGGSRVRAGGSRVRAGGVTETGRLRIGCCRVHITCANWR
jgi:hypothetical protein